MPSSRTRPNTDTLMVSPSMTAFTSTGSDRVTRGVGVNVCVTATVVTARAIRICIRPSVWRGIARGDHAHVQTAHQSDVHLRGRSRDAGGTEEGRRRDAGGTESYPVNL